MSLKGNIQKCLCFLLFVLYSTFDEYYSFRYVWKGDINLGMHAYMLWITVLLACVRACV